MGKRGKSHRQPRRPPSSYFVAGDDDGGAGDLPSAAYDLPAPLEEAEEEEAEEEENNDEDEEDSQLPSKFELYELSVQSPKGDISYMQKFFLMYIGSRAPLHLQEDFCGTALLSVEWLRGDPRRTSVGLDLDLEALKWCVEKNLRKVGIDGNTRISLFHGNVLQPQKACLVKSSVQDNSGSITLHDETVNNADDNDSGGLTMEKAMLPARDIVCAFNYSCCCLQKRLELVLYFKYVHSILSKKGGLFVMDVYGGTSSECKLRLRRQFSKFTYYWEQEDFDIINRRTKISLHFQVGKKQIQRHAFSYKWRLWSLPEIKDCLEDAGFQVVHFWMREMPDTGDPENTKEYSLGHDIKYEESSSFEQRDAWNAYVVAVANK